MRTLLVLVLLLPPVVDAWRPMVSCSRAASRGVAITCMHAEGQQQPQEDGKESRRRKTVDKSSSSSSFSSSFHLSRGQQLQNVFAAAVGATTTLALWGTGAGSAVAAMGKEGGREGGRDVRTGTSKLDTN